MIEVVDPWPALDAQIRAEAAAPWSDDYDVGISETLVSTAAALTPIAVSPSPSPIEFDRIRFELFPLALLEQIRPPSTATAPWASPLLAEFPRPPWYRTMLASPSRHRVLRAAGDRHLTVWMRPAAHGRFLRSVATVAEDGP